MELLILQQLALSHVADGNACASEGVFHLLGAAEIDGGDVTEGTLSRRRQLTTHLVREVLLQLVIGVLQRSPLSHIHEHAVALHCRNGGEAVAF